MKKHTKLNRRELLRQPEAMATDATPAIQMMLPMAEVGWPRQGVVKLVRQTGLQLMELLMPERAGELSSGAANNRRKGRPSLWCSEQGPLPLDG